jgi:hypothetical protein
MDNFIGVYENRLDISICNEIIQVLDDIKDTNPSEVISGDEQFPNGDAGRKDFSIFLDEIDRNLSREVNSCLNGCILEYFNKYGVLKESECKSIRIKIQKTPIGGGYHRWHSEAFNISVTNRVLVWAIYLNDMPDGEGETEFLYQSKRYKPKMGNVLIWPAGFTHTHRGNPPLTTEKYIATGWYCFY